VKLRKTRRKSAANGLFSPQFSFTLVSQGWNRAIGRGLADRVKFGYAGPSPAVNS
jgi:hypothetical protein